MHTTTHTTTTTRSLPRAEARGAFDWGGQIRLGIVLSVAAAIVAAGLAGRVADQVLVIGSMVVASVLAWRRVDAVPRPARAHLRRR